MAMSLGFHIIFASISMILPFLMNISYAKWLKTNDETYLTLTKIWQKGVAILFAVGAVSGTILSFELGLLWPTFMKHAGPIFGMPFSLEGAAFFIEAVAMGFFLYGWNRMPVKLHQFFGILVGVMGVMSGLLVISANGWMNAPTGFDYIDGQFTNIDPIKALFNTAWFHQALHMLLAAFQATCLLVLGIHSALLLKNPNQDIHRKACMIALVPCFIVSLIMPFSGDLAAKHVAKHQPLKLAAMESHFHTERRASIVLGGIPDLENLTVPYSIEIPGVLSILATGDLDGEVKGLTEWDRSLWPPVVVVHVAFQIMVGIGMMLVVLSPVVLWRYIKRRETLFRKGWLWLFTVISPLGFVALEAGWVVTEVGRQPWIIYGIMKTKDAVTPVEGVQFYFFLFLAIYLLLSFTVLWLMVRQFKAATCK